MTIAYTLKQNQRPIGQELIIVNEPHFIGTVGVFTTASGRVKLTEVPLRELPSTVIVPGYTEVTSTPGPLEFRVDYGNGWLTFDSSQDGLSVLVSYKGRGSEVDAVDINEVQTPVGVALQSNGEITAGHVKPPSISTNPADNFTFPNDVTVAGNLTVTGTTTTINTQNLTVEDHIITLGFGTVGAPTEDSGFEVARGSSPTVRFLWDETVDAWTLRNTSNTPILSAFDTGLVDIPGTLSVGSLTCSSVLSNTSVTFGIDEDNNSITEKFVWRTNGSLELLRLTEGGKLCLTGLLGVGTISPDASIHNTGSSIIGLTADLNPASITLTEVDTYSGIVISTTLPTVVTLPSPTSSTAGREFYVIHQAGSSGTLTVNGFVLSPGTQTSFVWSGTAWTLLTAQAKMPVVTVDPVSPAAGDFWLNSTDGQVKAYNGTDIVILG